MGQDDTGSNGGGPGGSDASGTGSDRGGGDRDGGDHAGKSADNVSRSDSITTKDGWTVSGEMGNELATKNEYSDGAIRTTAQLGAEGFTQSYNIVTFTEGVSIPAPTQPDASHGHQHSGGNASDKSAIQSQADSGISGNAHDTRSTSNSDGPDKANGGEKAGGNQVPIAQHGDRSASAPQSDRDTPSGRAGTDGFSGGDATVRSSDKSDTNQADPGAAENAGRDLPTKATGHDTGRETANTAGDDAAREHAGSTVHGRGKADAPVGNSASPVGATLSPFEEWLDGIVNPSAAEHPFQRAVVDNMNRRGEAIANGVVDSIKQQGAFMNALAEGRVGDAIEMRGKNITDSVKGAAVGFGHSVETAGNALGDLAYFGTHGNEPGAAEKLGNATVDAVLETANIVGALDGAASLTELGVAAAGRNALREGLEASEEGLQAGSSGAGKHGGSPPELPPPEAPPPGGAEGTPKQTTESIFGEINQELASVPEGEGPLPNGHRGPGIGGYSGAPRETGVYRQDGGHHVHQGANYAPLGTPTRNAPGYMDGTTVDLSHGEHANVHRVTNAVNRGLHGAEVDRAIGGDISAGQYGTTFGEGTAYNGPGVHVRATGDGTRAAIGPPPATPWTADTTAYYGLRASGNPMHGTIQGALDAVIQSDRALDAVGVQPVRVPRR